MNAGPLANDQVRRPLEAVGSAAPIPSTQRVAFVGNPNAGKTSLFNRLTGLRAHTANFAGTTVEHRQGPLRAGDGRVAIELIDLPGLYSLEAVTPDEQAALAALEGRLAGEPKPDAVVLVLDATNLERNLPLAIETLGRGLPTLAALNMSDLADRLGLRLDLKELSARLGCPVVRVSARTSDGVDELATAIQALVERRPLPQLDAAACACTSCSGCNYASRFDWAAKVREASVKGDLDAPSRVSDALDRVLTHRVGGLVVFALAMLATFMLIFSVAAVPMDLLDGLFGWAGQTVGRWMPDGDLKSLVVDGLIGGVGGVLVFLPQICLLFFLLSLLEDSGYLARAALVMDHLMRRVGLPGKAFVPMLSAHACAIPAIMATRVIEDRRDRLATILVAPLMSCSARVPVYVMVMALMFPNDPLKASLLFAGAYLLGIVAALGAAWVLKRSVLKGESRPLVIELPNYRLPSLTNAFATTLDRAWMFLKNAGTTILVISVVLWAMATYPKTDRDALPEPARAELAALDEAGDEAGAERLVARVSLENSVAGRLGRLAQPLFAPLGFDWQTTVGVGTSFAAREVVVSTLSVLYGLGADGDETSLLGALASAKRDNGESVFDTPTCLSLLVFYVLAMQCLPTQAVTLRETGSWKWPLLQLGYMSVLAYVAALVVHQVARLLV
ncbi:MAG: ferrous iron transport protein B [Lacipirellulaceae bacterium]